MKLCHGLAGIGTAACYASSPVLVRFGLRLGGTPLVAVTVGLLVATVFYLIFAVVLRAFTSRRENQPASSVAAAGPGDILELGHRPGDAGRPAPDLANAAAAAGPGGFDHTAARGLSRRGAYLFQIGAAVAIGLGTWFRYIALDIVPLAYVATLIRVNILVVLLLTPLLLPGRKHKVTLRTVLGAAMIIAGTVLVSLG